MISETRKKLVWWLLPNLLFLIAMFAVSPLDLPIEQFFYRGGRFVDTPLVRWIYWYGFYPAIIVADLGGLLFLVALCVRRWRPLWRPGLFLFLTFLFGWGLLIHGVFKGHWGRPRPRQLEQFGGTEEYRAFYQPNWTWPHPNFQSFPSGHGGSGFYLIALAFVGRRHRSKTLVWSGIALGTGSGALLGLVRMAQGAHFLTDILGSAWAIYLSCQICDWVIYDQINHKKPH
jgi:lipid A 4'-phosphatase